jgi:hypothetical protein
MDGSVLWHHFIELGPIISPSFWTPVITKYMGTYIYSLLEHPSFNSLMGVKLDITGQNAPVSYEIINFGSPSTYNILSATFSSSLILVGVISSTGPILFKIDISSLPVTYSEIALDPGFEVKDVLFPDTSTDLDFIYAGTVSSVSDGAFTLSYGQKHAFLVRSTELDVCLTFTYVWTAPVSVTSITSFPNSETSLPSF